MGRYRNIGRENRVGYSFEPRASKRRLSRVLLPNPADGEFVYDSTQCIYVEVWYVGRIFVSAQKSVAEESVIVQQIVRIRRRDEEDTEGSLTGDVQWWRSDVLNKIVWLETLLDYGSGLEQFPYMGFHRRWYNYAAVPTNGRVICFELIEVCASIRYD